MAFRLFGFIYNKTESKDAQQMTKKHISKHTDLRDFQMHTFVPFLKHSRLIYLSSLRCLIFHFTMFMYRDSCECLSQQDSSVPYGPFKKTPVNMLISRETSMLLQTFPYGTTL